MWVSVNHLQDGRNKTGLMPAGKLCCLVCSLKVSAADAEALVAAVYALEEEE